MIGEVVQVMGLGPHRLSANSRPEWFFKKAQYGGILTDIGSHQAEQFLHYTNSTDATVTHAAVGNYHHPKYEELEDYGEASLVGDQGARGYFRVDWLTPLGLGSWGDGRTVILGTKGYMEMRKYIDVARSKEGENLYLVTDQEERHLQLKGKIGYPFFGQMILDCLNRTENAMTQAHIFKAAELCLKSQNLAEQKEIRKS
ncbi:MAG: Gfo/Idh/MocA family oxidoreductase, partial [Verrucomicrobiota bacterium]